MIKINLLPFRATRQKEAIKRQVTFFFLVVVLLLAALGFVFLQVNGRLKKVESEKTQLLADLKTYDKILKEIKENEKKIAEIQAKLTVIRELEKNKSGPVHLLDEIAMAVPKDKLFLTSLSESKGSLTLMGTAMDNETVALFMTNLEQSDYIQSVDLNSVKLRYLPAHKLRISDFILDCKTYAYKEKPKTTTKKGGKSRQRPSKK